MGHPVYKVNIFFYHNLVLFSQKNYKNTNVLSKSLISITLNWDILQFNFENYWTWTLKISNCLTGLGLTLRYIWLELKKYRNYLNGLELILWYIGVRREKYLDHLTAFGLIL